MPHDAPRLQPHNLDWEREVIGASLEGLAFRTEAKMLLCPEDFYFSEHQSIWAALCALPEQVTNAYDPLPIMGWLKAQGRYWDEALADCYQMAHECIVPGSYVKRIHWLRELSVRRQLIAMAFAWQDACYLEPCNPTALVNIALTRLHDLKARLAQYSTKLAGYLSE